MIDRTQQRKSAARLFASAEFALLGRLLSIEILQNLLCQWFFDLGMPGDSFNRSILRINPK
jgi:hypothetical protein